MEENRNNQDVKQGEVVDAELVDDLNDLKKFFVKNAKKAESWLWGILIFGVCLNVLLAAAIIASIIFFEKWGMLIWLVFPLGASIAVAISWERNHSVKLAILHGLLGIAYVGYYVVSNKITGKTKPIVDEDQLRKDVFGR